MKKRVGVRLLALVLIIALLGSMVPVSAASNYYIGTARNWPRSSIATPPTRALM